MRNGVELRGLPYPPSMNHRYQPKGGRLVLSSEHRIYKNILGLHLDIHHDMLDASVLKGKLLEVEIKYNGPEKAFFTADGSFRKVDVDNRHKSLLDGVLPFLGLDDSQVFRLLLVKNTVYSASEMQVDISIRELEG